MKVETWTSFTSWLFILGFALLVAPVLAVIGFNRSTAAQQEIARLRQRIEVLEQRGAAQVAPETEQVQAVTPAVVTAPVAEDAPAPVDPGVPTFLQPRQNPLRPLRLRLNSLLPLAAL